MVLNFYSNKKIGNKAANLIWLKKRLGQVPPFLLINPACFIIDFEGWQKKIDKVLESISHNAIDPEAGNKTISTLIDSAKIKTVKIKLKKDKKYLFRTSAENEDGSTASFAGMYLSSEPFAGVDFNPALFLKQSWKSLYAVKAILYAAAKDIELKAQNFSLIIQEFYQSEFAGVAFANPDKCRAKISFSNFGAKNIVEGENAISLIMDLKSPDLRQVADSFENKIEPKTLSRFIDALRKIALAKGVEQDIEWAINKDDFAILQTRDVTAAPTDDETIYDNTNIAESYPGITAPLTYSFIKFAYAQVYKNFLIFVGTNPRRLKKFEQEAGNLLGQIKGRVYYNVKNWYEMIELLPGYRQNKNFFESMWNPGEKMPEEKRRGLRRRWIFILPLIINFFGKIIFAQIYIAGFIKLFNRRYANYRQTDLTAKTAGELADHYQRIENDFFFAWSVPILNDFRVMIFQGVLRRMIKESGVRDRNIDRCVGGLIAQDKEIFSLKPLFELQALSAEIKKNHALSELFNANDDRCIYDKIDNDYSVEMSSFKKKIQNYLNDFGDRNPSELKLESPTARSNPEMIIAILKKYLAGDAFPCERQKTNQQDKIFTELKNKFACRFSFLNHFFWPIFKTILKETKKSVANREKMRLLRSRAYNLAREVYLRYGLIFKNNGTLIEAGDVFYLTREEILDLARGKDLGRKADEIAGDRKKTFAAYRNEPDPPRRFKLSELETLSKAEHSDQESQEWTGIAASPGIVKGEALCLKEFNPKADFKNKILITAQTDPGWTIVFPLIKGLATEKGNILSHAAIISRELNIPSTLGVENILQKINTGDLVEINGSDGKIKLIKKI